MHVFVCVFLTNHQWPSGRQHGLSDTTNNGATESVNQKSVSDPPYCRINCYINQYDLIQQAVQPHWPPFYLNRLVNNSTNQHTYLPICSATSSSNCTSISPLQPFCFQEIPTENIRVCTPNRRVLSTSVQEPSSIRPP